MRVTGPSARRRNSAWLENKRRWLAQKRDDEDDGFASAEDDGDVADSVVDDESDDELAPLIRPVRPALTNAVVRPTLGALPGTPTAVARLPQPSRVTTLTAPAATQAAANNEAALVGVTPGVTLGAEDPEGSDSVSDGISSGIESGSGDELSDYEPVPGATGIPGATPIEQPEATVPGGQPQATFPGAAIPPAATVAPIFQPPLAAPPDAAPQPAPAPGTTMAPGTMAPGTMAPGTMAPDTMAPAPPSTTAVGAAPVWAPVYPDGTTSSPSSSPTATTSSSSSNGAAVPAVTETPSTSSELVPTLAVPGRTDIPEPSTTVAPALPDSPPLDTGLAPPSTTALGNTLAETNGNTPGPVAEEQNNVDAGAAAGIVIGVLALIGIFIAAGFVWRKWKKGGKNESILSDLPVFNRRVDKGDSPVVSINEKDTIPILPPPVSMGSKKTNSEMMDQLMQATYKAENGDVDPRGDLPGAPGAPAAYGQPRPGFMNETTYTALAGPPTPVGAVGPGNRRSKPVIRWLDDVRTPSQAPVTPGSANWSAPDYPPMPPLPQARGPPSLSQQDVPVGKPPADNFMPPQPPFRNDPRYTQTTTTTQTSSSDVWHG